MPNTPHAMGAGTNLLLTSATALLPVLAAPLVPGAHAQIRRIPPVITSPAQPAGGQVAAPVATGCPADIAQAQREGRRIPANCPAGASSPPPIERRVQTPVAVTPARQIRETPPSIGNGPVRRVPGDQARQGDAPIRTTPIRTRESGDGPTAADGVRRLRQVPEQRVPDQSRIGTTQTRPPADGRTSVPPPGGRVPPGLPGGITGQVQCFVPLGASVIMVNDGTQTMWCGLPGPVKAMKFRFTPKQWGIQSDNYKAGFATRITHGAAVDGVHPVIAADEGFQVRAKAVCVPIRAQYYSRIIVPPKPPTSHELWCTADGKVVKPIDIGWVANSEIAKLRNATVEDGPIEISYFHVTTPHILDTVRTLERYPAPGSSRVEVTAVQDRAKVESSAKYTVGGNPLTYAQPPLTGPVHMCWLGKQDYRQGHCLSGRIGKQVEYNAYATSDLANAASRPAPSGHYRSVRLSIMPGIIPPQYRARAAGACRVLLGVEILFNRIEQPIGVTQGEKVGEYKPNVPTSTASGMPGSEPTPPPPPIKDNCQN